MKIRNIELALHENEDLSNAIRRNEDFFEAEILDYLAEHHKKQNTILDIGANIGNHSVYFANFLDYESILCFEPIQENFDLLKINMQPYSNIGLINMAVSNSTKELSMIKDHRNMGSSRIYPGGNISVKAITLDRLSLRDVTLMKIDVEEHEPQVLEGAVDTIWRCRPLILMEDWDNEYAALLTGYSLEKPWPQHKTYLYTYEG